MNNAEKNYINMREKSFTQNQFKAQRPYQIHNRSDTAKTNSINTSIGD